VFLSSLFVLVVITYVMGIFEKGTTSLVYAMLISGIITGYFSGKDYLSGIINSLIIAFCICFILASINGIRILLDILYLLGMLAVIGGLIGVLINNKLKNLLRH